MAVAFHVVVGVGVDVGVDKDMRGRNLLRSQLMNLTRNWIAIMQMPCKLSQMKLWKVLVLINSTYAICTKVTIVIFGILTNSA